MVMQRRSLGSCMVGLGDGAGAVLLPYTSDKLTVFANADGIEVSF